MVTESLILYGVLGGVFLVAALLSWVRGYVMRRDYSAELEPRATDEVPPPLRQFDKAA